MGPGFGSVNQKNKRTPTLPDLSDYGANRHSPYSWKGIESNVSLIREHAMHRTRSLLLSLCLTTAVLACERSANSSFATFVDRYLDDFARRHPSIAAGNGLHQHDDLLEDFSASGIREEIAALKRDAATLAAFDTTDLSPDERVDRLILMGIIDGWLLEQETLQNWKRNPMLYASAVSDGVHNLMAMESDPAPVRMRRIISKLAQVHALTEAAQANISNPPKLLAERGVSMMQGAIELLGKDLDLAFARDTNVYLRDSLRRAADDAIPHLKRFVGWLEHDVIPKANGEIAIGAEALARRYLAEDMIDTPLDTMLAIGERELVVAQNAFADAARRLVPNRDPLEVWREVRRDHPAPGGVVAATRVIVDSLAAFVERKGIASLPPDERVVVEPALPFDLGFASMHASPPLEKTPVRSVYYITEPPPDMPKAEADAWLERYNYASLENTSAHEAIPGHWLHSIYMRETPGKVRRIWIGLNPFPQPSSGQDGWAHYAEQMVLDEGFGNNDPKYRLAQLSDGLTRICRLLSGIRIHTKHWSVDEAQRCFEEWAYVAKPAAKREAERAVYDPTYGGYFLGKRGFLVLREDYQKKMGDRFNLREFHERVMTNGIAPVRAHRMLMLPGDTGPVIR